MAVITEEFSEFGEQFHAVEHRLMQKIKLQLQAISERFPLRLTRARLPSGFKRTTRCRRDGFSANTTARLLMLTRLLPSLF